MTDCGETALMHEWCMAQVWCIRCTSTWTVLIHVGDPCVLKRAKPSVHNIPIDSRYSSRFDDSVFTRGRCFFGGSGEGGGCFFLGERVFFLGREGGREVFFFWGEREGEVCFFFGGEGEGGEGGCFGERGGGVFWERRRGVFFFWEGRGCFGRRRGGGVFLVRGEGCFFGEGERGSFVGEGWGLGGVLGGVLEEGRRGGFGLFWAYGSGVQGVWGVFWECFGGGGVFFGRRRRCFGGVLGCFGLMV